MPDLPKYAPDNPEYHVVDASNNALNYPNILSKIVSDRIYFLNTSIRESNRLLLQRTELKNIHQLEISKDMCKIKNLLFELENKGKDIGSLELRLADLSKEERQNELSHWHDTVDLNRELRNTEKELRAAMLDLWMIEFLS